MIQSKPYQPNPSMCCERCAFGSGKHPDWCQGREAKMARLLDGMRDRLTGEARRLNREYDVIFRTGTKQELSREFRRPR